jgi:hypothetical protein
MSFQLIKTKSLTISRQAAGSYVKGKFVKGTPTPIVINAHMTPVIKQSMLQFLPESLRAKKVFRLMSNDLIKGFQDKEEKQQADEFTLGGESFRIVKVGEWENVSGYTAYEAYAIKIDSEVIAVYGG